MTTLDRKNGKLPDRVADLTDKERSILMPEWKSSQPNDDSYMVKAKGLKPAPVEGQNLVAMRPDGFEPVEASVPHLPFEYWISPAGNIQQIPFRTNRVHEDGQSIDDGPYKNATTEDKYRKGWIKYHTGRQGEPIEEWLARRDKVIDQRQGRQKVRTEKAEADLQEKERRQGIKLQEALVAALKTAGAGEEDRARRADAKANLKKGR